MFTSCLQFEKKTEPFSTLGGLIWIKYLKEQNLDDFYLTVKSGVLLLIQVLNERDALAQESRDRETRILSLNNDLESLRSQLEESERVKRMLQMELDESARFL